MGTWLRSLPIGLGLSSQDLGKLWSENPATIPLLGWLQGWLLPLCNFGLPISILGCLPHGADGDVTTPIPSQTLGQGKPLNRMALPCPHGEVTRDVQVT